MSYKLSKPDDFWEVRCHSVDRQGVSGLCVGYEQSKWRQSAFVDYVMEWLPEFSLNAKERETLKYSNAVESLRKAAKLVYKTEKFKNRGEFGEIFLHAAVRSVFNSSPAISKIYYKSSHNETVKGFDCVHVVGPLDSLELWIGEVKFYKDIARAIREVVDEIKNHLNIDYLRDEFVLIENKLNNNDKRNDKIKSLISKKRSMDEIFKQVCIPVLLTYESDVIQKHQSICDNYIKEFNSEIEKYKNKFFDKDLPDVKIHLFLLPLAEKVNLIKALDSKVKIWGQL